MGEEEWITEEPTVALTSVPVMTTRTYLDRLAQQQDGTFRASYSGMGLDTVAAAYVGDQACIIAGQSESSLQLDVSAQLPNGMYEIRLETQDGIVYSFPDMLVIGDQLNCRNYRAGSLQISTAQALWLDNTLVLGNRLEMRELPADDGTVNTLDLQLDGVLVFPGDSLPAGVVGADGTVQQDLPDQIDLGGTGSSQGRGTLRINRGDKAYADSVDTIILRDAILLEYDTENSRFVAGEEVAQ